MPTTDIAVPRTHVRRTGLVRVAAPVATAFPLFTPVGEKLWAPGWDPEFHQPVSGGPEVGAAFSTWSPDGRPTHWLIIDWEPEQRTVRYARMTPGLRVGTVEVTCEADGPAATRAHVTYDLTAIAEEGDAELAGWTEAWFAGFLQEWEEQIAQVLSTTVGQSIPAARTSPVD